MEKIYQLIDDLQSSIEKKEAYIWRLEDAIAAIAVNKKIKTNKWKEEIFGIEEIDSISKIRKRISLFDSREERDDVLHSYRVEIASYWNTNWEEYEPIELYIR